MLNWSERELKEALERNPELHINKKYSMPAKKKKAKVDKPKIPKRPLKFYELDEERTIRIFTVNVPPSLNDIIGMNPNIQNAKKQEFMEALQWEMVVQGVKVFRSPVDLLIEVYFPVYRGRDKDNYLKWTKDALKGFAVVDDSPKYIPNEDVQFPKGKHHMEIILTPIKDGD